MQEQWEKNRAALGNLPENIFKWMEPHILSEKMQACCSSLQLKVLSMKNENIDINERVFLSQYCNVESSPLLRQITLLGDSTPYSYARVIIPEQTYNANKQKLEALKNGMIGIKMLHYNPDVSRTNFEYTTIVNTMPLFKTTKHYFSDINETAKLYARRSVFHIKENPLLITEVFLPGIPTFPQQKCTL